MKKLLYILIVSTMQCFSWLDKYKFYCNKCFTNLHIEPKLEMSVFFLRLSNNYLHLCRQSWCAECWHCIPTDVWRSDVQGAEERTWFLSVDRKGRCFSGGVLDTLKQVLEAEIEGNGVLPRARAYIILIVAIKTNELWQFVFQWICKQFANSYRWNSFLGIKKGVMQMHNSLIKCGKGESNSHTLTGVRPWNVCVYQFRHSRVFFSKAGAKVHRFLFWTSKFFKKGKNSSRYPWPPFISSLEKRDWINAE